MARVSALTESRLTAPYGADEFGGEKTMRAKVIRELIDEIRGLLGEGDVIARRAVSSAARRDESRGH